MRVTVGDSGLFRACLTSFERYLPPLCVDSVAIVICLARATSDSSQVFFVVAVLVLRISSAN